MIDCLLFNVQWHIFHASCELLALYLYLLFIQLWCNNWKISTCSQTCIKRSHLGQRKSGLLRQVTS
jgi:hypothetical protein